MHAMVLRMLEYRDQSRVFGRQPRPCLSTIGDPDLMNRGAEIHRQPGLCREDQPVSGRSGLGIPDSYIAQCSTTIHRRLIQLRPVGGVDVHEVVESVPHAVDRLDQMHLGEGFEVLACTGYVDAGERGCSVYAELGIGVQTQASERTSLLSRQTHVRPVQHGTNRGALVAGTAQYVQTSLRMSDVIDHVGNADVLALRDMAGRDAHRQRQPRAQPDKLDNGVRLGRNPVYTDHPAHQLSCLVRRERVQGDPMSGLRDGQSGQRSPAGHEYKAVRGAGEQWSDLIGAHGIVQHDQHPSSRNQ
jgi:hypothetical protein